MKQILAVKRVQGEILILSVVLIAAVAPAFGKDKQKKTPDEDRICVIAHIPLDGKAQRNIVEAEHWRRRFLYIESADGNQLTVVDVTAPASPAITQRVQTNATSVASAVGTALLVASDQSDRTPPPTQTLSILNLSGDGSPRLVQEFKGVTSVHRDGAQIYLVNGDGLWVLQQRPAEDKQLDKEYSDYVLYSH
jgi:hypothetical protein